MTTTRIPWVFQDEQHWTMHDLIETLSALSEQKEIDEFQSSYAEVCGSDEIAEQNIGYMLFLIQQEGSKKESRRLSDLFGIEPQESRLHHTFGASSLGIGPRHPAHPMNAGKKDEDDE